MVVTILIVLLAAADAAKAFEVFGGCLALASSFCHS